MRVATWNLDRPTVNRRTRDCARLAEIRRHRADTWILTETTRNLDLNGYQRASTVRPALDRYGPEEVYASIHSAFPIKPVAFEVFDPRFTVCAEVDSPLGPTLVYGSIITYHSDGVLTGEATRWERHRTAIVAQGADWAALRDCFPDHMIIVGGDFNQVLDGVGRYRDTEALTLLKQSLVEAGLAA